MTTNELRRPTRRIPDGTTGSGFPAPVAGTAWAPSLPAPTVGTARGPATPSPFAAPRWEAPAARQLDDLDGARCALPANHPAATGQVALLAGRASAAAIATGSPTALSVDEVRRVERTLIVALSSGAHLPNLRSLAAVAGVTKHRLRRAVGSVELAAQAIVDERFTIARTCTEMPTGWHPSLEVLGGRLVTHRLFVYSIVIDVVEAATHCTATAAEFADLERALGDELRYQVRRWHVFDDDADVERFVRDVAEIFSFARIRSLDHGSRDELERRLNHDLAQVFDRHGAVERWNESRHEWFDVDRTPMRRTS